MVRLLGWFDHLKWKILDLFGYEPPLHHDVIERLKESKPENKDHIPTPNPNILKCTYKTCRRRLSGFTYKCPYCHGRFCEKHRLPEDHDCENPSLPSEMRMGYGIKYASQETSANAQAEKN